MYHFNDLDTWRLRREELIREAENERLVRRQQPRRSGAVGVFVAALVATTLLLMLVAAGPASAATSFTVNSVSDAADANLTDSFCDANPLPQVELYTLRAAIQEANDTPGADVIDFNIFGIGVKTISPTSELPAITGALTVDGYSQPGASPNTSAKSTNAKLLIELDGTNAAGLTDGLVINASNVVVRGLVINRFDSDNIRIFSSGGPTDNNRIEGNFIGTGSSGTLGLGNALGVDVLDGENNTVGDTSPASRSLISGNSADGVFIGIEAPGTRVQGNLIGTERDGKSPLGNADEGVDIFNAEGTTVGGATPGAANRGRVLLPPSYKIKGCRMGRT